MKSLFILVSLFCTVAAADSKTFGEAFEGTSPKTMADVLKDSDKYLSEDVVVSAQVDKVCKKKGCWFQVKNSDGTTRVVFKDYSFFVPKDIDGKKITMNGRLKSKTMSVSEQRHFLKDEGASKEEIKAITEPKKVFQFVASGVQI